MALETDNNRRKQQLKREYEELQKTYAHLKARYNRIVEYEGPQLNFLYISLQDDTSPLRCAVSLIISSTLVLLPFFTAIPNWDISLVPKSRGSRISWMPERLSWHAIRVKNR